MRMYEPLALDVNRERVYGWQRSVTAETVDALLQAIDLHIELPKPYIRKLKSGIYELSYGAWDEFDIRDGAHHRAVAFSIADKPMPCWLVERDAISRIKNQPVRIQDIEIISNPRDYRMTKAFKTYL